MSSSKLKDNTPESGKTRLPELIADLQEESALQLLKELHAGGEDSSELLHLCMEGVRRVGERFEKGEYYISALIMGGEIMRRASGFLNSFLPPVDQNANLGHILLGTIKGDIHDLGKNILKDMLTCNGFVVTDLGVDVPVKTFVEKTASLNPDFVAISCLLTSCLDELAKAVKAVRKEKSGIKDFIIVGGSCLDELVADFVKADMWFTDAMKGVGFFKEAIASRK